MEALPFSNSQLEFEDTEADLPEDEQNAPAVEVLLFIGNNFPPSMASSIRS